MSLRPWYNQDANYQTNAKSFMDYLARTNKFLEVLIEDYEIFQELIIEELERIKFDSEMAVDDILLNWLDDGTLARIINDGVLGNKADTDWVDNQLNQLREDIQSDIERLEETDNILDKYVSPLNFDSIQECYEYAFTHAKTIKIDELHLTENTSLRSVGLDIGIVYLNGFELEIGGFNGGGGRSKRDKGYNPIQSIERVFGAGGGENDKFFIRGASYQEINIGNYNGHIQIRLNDFDGWSSYTSYTTFNFGDIVGLSISEDVGAGAKEPNTGLWFSENTLNVQNIMYFEMGDVGGYQHSMNRFYGGTFESGAGTYINIKSGSYNRFYNIRGEAQPLTITFGEKTRFNEVEMGHYSYTPLKNDKGYGNVVSTPTERNNRLILNESIQVNVISSGGLTRKEYINHPFRNLELDTENLYFIKNTSEYAGDIFYETPFLRNPKELRFLMEANLKDKNGLGVGYKYYDENYNDITREIGDLDFTAYIITSRERSVYTRNEGGYVGPSHGLTLYTNDITENSDIYNDILSLFPSGHWTTISNEVKNRIKYVKFFVGNLTTNTSTPKILDMNISVYNIVNNYHKKYFDNTMTDFRP